MALTAVLKRMTLFSDGNAVKILELGNHIAGFILFSHCVGE